MDITCSPQGPISTWRKYKERHTPAEKEPRYHWDCLGRTGGKQRARKSQCWTASCRKHRGALRTSFCCISLPKKHSAQGRGHLVCGICKWTVLPAPAPRGTSLSSPGKTQGKHSIIFFFLFFFFSLIPCCACPLKCIRNRKQRRTFINPQRLRWEKLKCKMLRLESGAELSFYSCTCHDTVVSCTHVCFFSHLIQGWGCTLLI